VLNVSEFWEILEGLDRSFAVESHMQTGMIIVPEPSVKCFFEVLSCVIALEAVEFLLVGLVRSFDPSIEARGARGDEAMRGTEALAGGTKRVSFDGAIEWGFRASGIPMGEDRIVVGLDDADRKGKRGQDVLGKGFGDMDSHFFAELNEAEAGAAIDGRILVEASTLEQIRNEFNIDLDEISGARDNEATAVAFGFGFASPGEALAFDDFGDGRGRGKVL
jgi:hypothetical protein